MWKLPKRFGKKNKKFTETNVSVKFFAEISANTIGPKACPLEHNLLRSPFSLLDKEKTTTKPAKLGKKLGLQDIFQTVPKYHNNAKIPQHFFAENKSSFFAFSLLIEHEMS